MVKNTDSEIRRGITRSLVNLAAGSEQNNLEKQH